MLKRILGAGKPWGWGCEQWRCRKVQRVKLSLHCEFGKPPGLRVSSSPDHEFWDKDSEGLLGAAEAPRHPEEDVGAAVGPAAPGGPCWHEQSPALCRLQPGCERERVGNEPQARTCTQHGTRGHGWSHQHHGHPRTAWPGSVATGPAQLPAAPPRDLGHRKERRGPQKFNFLLLLPLAAARVEFNDVSQPVTGWLCRSES